MQQEPRGAALGVHGGERTEPTEKTPVIQVSGCVVRISGDVPKGIPRRQSFAWEANARDFAERLSAEHGWLIVGEPTASRGNRRKSADG